MPTEQILDVQQLAALIDLTPRRVQQLKKQGMPTRGRGRYPAVMCVRWYVQYLRSQATAPPDGDVEARKQLALARKYEATVDVMLGRLVDMDEALDVFEGVLSRVRARMTSITGRLIPLLTRYEPSEALEIIEPVVREVMEAASVAATEDEEQEAAA